MSEKLQNKHRRFSFGILLLLALAVPLWRSFGSSPAQAATGINKQINFQGKLVNTNGTNITDGTYNLEFKLWDAASSGSNLWTEDRIGNAGSPDRRVTVTNGIFQVNLGSVTTLPGSVDFNTDNIYLSINLGGTNLACTAAGTFTADTNCAADGEMSPRVQFTASPYAFNSDKLDGIDSAGFVQLGQSASAQTDSSTANPSIFINKTNASGTPNILQLQKSGTDVLSVSNTGSAFFRPTADSTTAFRIQNSSSNNILNVDSTGSNQNNLLTNSSVESAIAGNWALKGAATATQDSTQAYDGANSLKIVTTAAANDGAKQAVTLSNSTAYSASFYIKLNSTSLGMATLAAGYSSDGSTDNTPCTLNTSTFNTTGWTRVTCNFTTPASNSGTPFFYIKQTDAVIHTFFVDGLLLQTDLNTDGNFRDGKMSIQGTVVSPLVLQNATNSSNAFSVQNSAGTQIFNVDTTDTNMISNPGFENNTSGWVYSGTPGSISRDTSQSWLGIAALAVTTSANTNQGAKITTGNVQPTQLAISTTYTLSWYAKSSNAFTDIMAAYSRDAATETQTCTPTSQVVATTGWTRFTCSFTTDGTTPNAAAYIVIRDTAASARTFYLDGVQLEASATASEYGAGSIGINGTITTPANFKNKSNSNTAFTVQNTSATPLFQVDTQNNLVYVGSPTADTTGTLLVLDTKNSAGDPTGVNGGMYYNSSTNTFRCFENSLWKNCIAPPSNASVADQTPSASTTAYLTGSNIAIPASGLRVGTQFVWRVTMSKTGAGTVANTFDVRFGTNGSAADASRCSFASGTQTGVIDTQVVDIIATVRSVSATSTLACSYKMVHNLSATGFDSQFVRTSNVTSGTFDNTVASSIVGLSYTIGASYAITVQQVQVNTFGW